MTAAKSFFLDLGNGKKITMVSVFCEARDKLGEAIEADRAGAVFGNTWKIATAFALSGADWPDWKKYHTQLRSRYRDRIRGPEYRDAVWGTEEERKVILWNRFEAAQGLAQYVYVPEEVRLPQFVEGSPVNVQWIRKFLNKRCLPQEVEAEWFLRSFDSQQVTIGRNHDFALSTWQVLVDAGLIAKNTEIPLQSALQVFSMKELRELLKGAGKSPEVTLTSARNSFYQYGKSDPEAAMNLLRAQIENRNIYMIRPPTGIAWPDFQSWRQQLRGIATAVTDIYAGDLKAEFALLKETPR